MWVLDHLEDIDSDMSVFHRVDDPRDSLPAPLYFARAVRLGAYQGVIQARVLERERGNAPTPGASGAAAGPVTKVSDDIALAQLANEGWIERG